jgi:hypothetical protein
VITPFKSPFSFGVQGQRRSGRGLLWLAGAAAALLAAPAPLHAETPAGRAEVRGLLGPATVTLPTGETRPLQAGEFLDAGATVKTGVGAAVELLFGAEPGMVRLTQKTTLTLNAINVAPEQKDFEVHLTLTEGTLLGRVANVPPTSKYRISIPGGIVGVVAGQFRVNAEGYHVLLDGTLVYVQLPATGDPVSHALKAPPEVYFSPSEGIRPAPVALVREVTTQFKARLQ